MGVSKNRGTPKSSILIGFSIINHPFWGYPYFWKHPHVRFRECFLAEVSPKELEGTMKRSQGKRRCDAIEKPKVGLWVKKNVEKHVSVEGGIRIFGEKLVK